MVATVTINPNATTNAAGSFNTTSAGGIQGTAMNDPAARNWLSGGILSTAETLPMWGGVAISEAVPPANSTSQPALGGAITRATTVSPTATNGLTGFSVFDQNHSALNSPQSPVPLVGSGGQVNFYRLGSLARIWVAMDPSLIDLDGNIISQQVSWDFSLQRLQPYVASGATEAVTSMTWSATNGGQVAVVMGSASIYGLGDTINVSGATNGGSGGVTGINTGHVINTWTDTTHFTFLLPGTAAQWGNGSAFGGTIVLNVGTGALPAKVLETQTSNCMTVAYDPVTGFATWNRNDAAALILI
jgi:hypothetical protein